MNKHKYLKELDLVCNSQKEMEHALEVLYKTIVLDGDIVVLSFNQLADSNLMVSFVENDAMRKVLLNLFYNRRIKVSKFGSYKSAVGYILRKIEKSLDSNKDFTFSAVKFLNNTSTKRKVFEILKKTLIYSELEYLSELYDIDNIDSDDIEVIYRYAQFLLKISLSDVEYTDAKQENKKDFVDCMNIAISALSDEKVIEKLKKLSNVMGGDNVRTNWITRAKELFKGEDNWLRNEIEKVIDVCYNLAVESGISVVRSSIADIDEQKEYFLDMYNDTSNNYEDNNHKYLWSEQNTDELLNFDDNDIEYWESFIRILENKKIHNKIIDSAESADFKPWIKIIDKYRIKRNVKIASLFLFTFVSLIAVNLTIDQIIDWFQLENISVINIVAKGVGFLLAILLGDFAGYVFQIPNLFELLLDKEQRLDMKTCKRIIKKKFYNGEN